MDLGIYKQFNQVLYCYFIIFFGQRFLKFLTWTLSTGLFHKWSILVFFKLKNI